MASTRTDVEVFGRFVSPEERKRQLRKKVRNEPDNVSLASYRSGRSGGKRSAGRRTHRSTSSSRTPADGPASPTTEYKEWFEQEANKQPARRPGSSPAVRKSGVGGLAGARRPQSSHGSSGVNVSSGGRGDENAPPMARPKTAAPSLRNKRPMSARRPLTPLKHTPPGLHPVLHSVKEDEQFRQRNNDPSSPLSSAFGRASLDDPLLQGAPGQWDSASSVAARNTTRTNVSTMSTTSSMAERIRANISQSQSIESMDPESAAISEFLERISEIEVLWEELHVPTKERSYVRRRFFANLMHMDSFAICGQIVDVLRRHRTATLNVLKCIHLRENALKQLGVMWERIPFEGHIKAETERMLATANFCSIKVVDAILNWRTTLWRPHAFIWNGQNYLLKMLSEENLPPSQETALALGLSTATSCNPLLAFGEIRRDWEKLRDIERVVLEEGVVQEKIQKEAEFLSNKGCFLPYTKMNPNGKDGSILLPSNLDCVVKLVGGRNAEPLPKWDDAEESEPSEEEASVEEEDDDRVPSDLTALPRIMARVIEGAVSQVMHENQVDSDDEEEKVEEARLSRKEADDVRQRAAIGDTVQSWTAKVLQYAVQKVHATPKTPGGLLHAPGS